MKSKHLFFIWDLWVEISLNISHFLLQSGHHSRGRGPWCDGFLSSQVRQDIHALICSENIESITVNFTFAILIFKKNTQFVYFEVISSYMRGHCYQPYPRIREVFNLPCRSMSNYHTSCKA